MNRLALTVLSLAAVLPSQLTEFATRYEVAEEQRSASAAPVVYRPLYQRAVRAFLKVPQTAPGYVAQLPAGGFAAYMAEDFTLSAELLAAAIDGLGDRDFLVEYRLRALAKSGDLKSAIAEGRHWHATHTAAVGRFLYALYSPVSSFAGARLRQGDRAVGLWCFRGLVKASADHPLALANLALALRYLGEFDEAGKLYARAIKAAPKDSVLWNDYGIFFKAYGREKKALEAYRRSIELEEKPGNSAAWTNMMFLWRNKRSLVVDATAAFRKLLAARPQQSLRRRLAIDAILARKLGAADAKAVVNELSGLRK